MDHLIDATAQGYAALAGAAVQVYSALAAAARLAYAALAAAGPFAVVACLAACVVLAEAFNKLERTDVLACGLTARERVVEALKALAWGLMALGAAGTLVLPLSANLPPDLRELASACVLVGFAVLIVRTRVKETLPGQAGKAESDDFTQTQIIRRR